MRRPRLLQAAAAGYGRLVLKPGAEAPDFAVEGQTLHALLARGPVVIFFFPKAFTPG